MPKLGCYSALAGLRKLTRTVGVLNNTQLERRSRPLLLHRPSLWPLILRIFLAQSRIV